MAMTKLSNITLAQARGEFHERLGSIPQVWSNHVQVIPANTKTETLSFPGFLPEPREFLNSRQVQGMLDFTFNVTNNTYELTLLVNRETLEDDMTGGTLMSRMREMAEVWGTFKDSQFAALLEAGDGAGNGWDGATFFNAARTIGSSGTIDNISTPVAAQTGAGLTTTPTADELLSEIQLIRAAMWSYADDQGRKAFNASAMSTPPRAIIPPLHERPFVEVANSTLIGVGDTAPGQTTNPFGRGIIDFDVLPYLTSDAVDYISLLGAERKPYIYSERTPLEIIFRSEPGEIAENDGLLVMTRQRYVLTYGEPRRAFQATWS